MFFAVKMLATGMGKSSRRQLPAVTGARPPEDIDPAPAARRDRRPVVPSPATPQLRRTRRRNRFAALATTVTRIAAVWSVLALVLRRFDWIHWVDDAFGVLNLPVAPSLFTVVLLLVLASALRRRLRVALLVLLAFQILGITEATAVLLTTAPHPKDQSIGAGELGSVLLSAAVLAGLAIGAMCWWARAAFPARLVPAARVRALLTLTGGLALSTVTSVALTEAFPDTLPTGQVRVAWAIRLVVGLPPDSADLGYDGHHGHHAVTALIGTLSAAALVAALQVFLRAGRAQRLLSPDDELRLRELLLDHGERDSLGYFATRRDKSAVFNRHRDSAVTYRVVGSVGLASADPVGGPAGWDSAIDAWLTEMRTYGWTPAVVSASEDGARAYLRAGLRALPFGDEAIVETAAFTLAGPTMQPVRRAVTRVHRAGYTAHLHRHSEIDAAGLEEIIQAADAWREGGDERGFSMALNRLADPADGRCLAVLARDSSGVLRGVQSYVPWGAHGLSLDLMRRDPTAENGVTEFLIASLLTGAPALGVQRVSLNFAVFRAVFSAAERVGAGPLVRLGNAGLTVASRFWQLKSLYRSNARYLPRWQPRYLCYDTAASLTAAVAAAGVAEGFLPGRPGRRRSHDTAPGQPRRPDDFAARVSAVEQAAVTGQPRSPGLRATRDGDARGGRRTDQELSRRHKLSLLEQAGMAGYPATVPRTCDLPTLRRHFGGLHPDQTTDQTVSVCGRVRAIRDFGGRVFAVLNDGSDRIQVLVDRDRIGPTPHALWRSTLDLGDHVSITGKIITTRTGELTVHADSWRMAAKCLRPLPGLPARRAAPDDAPTQATQPPPGPGPGPQVWADTVAGTPDPAAAGRAAGGSAADAPPRGRPRQRTAELIVNTDARNLLIQRTTATQALRAAFTARAFVEVETPMLHAVHGGANARPFTTRSNAYNLPLYLRIAPELFLKRLAVAGFGRIFEIGRNFRNEGADATHNPEFTALEAYQPYADYTDMRHLTRAVILEVAEAVHGAPVAHRQRPDGSTVTIDLTRPWKTQTVHDAVSRATGSTLTTATPAATLAALSRDHGIPVTAQDTPGSLITALYEELVERRTRYPTFYTDFPIETSPLTRTHRVDPALAERWDLVAFGAELGTAYSELTDPLDQRRRLTQQSLLAAAGDPDAMELDEDFLTDLEYAMPPTGGLGLGVDRLVMFLTGASIRSTLAFPLIRPPA